MNVSKLTLTALGVFSTATVATGLSSYKFYTENDLFWTGYFALCSYGLARCSLIFLDDVTREAYYHLKEKNFSRLNNNL